VLVRAATMMRGHQRDLGESLRSRGIERDRKRERRETKLGKREEFI